MMFLVIIMLTAGSFFVFFFLFFVDGLYQIKEIPLYSRFMKVFTNE